MLDDAHFITVTDIKQYAYCARVIFYERCLPHVRPRTLKMDIGAEAHADEQRRAVRRNLSQYDVLAGERRFDVRLSDVSLNLAGIVDEVVYPATGGCFPVDYKMAKQASRHYRLQLTAYALLLEANEGVRIEHGFIYLIPTRKLTKVNFTDAIRSETLGLLADVQQMIAREQMPDPAKKRQYCTACEFRRFCNDV